MFKGKIFIFLAIISVAMISCKDDDDEILEATALPLRSSQQVPTNSSTATGTVDAKFNKSTNVLTYTLTWANLTGDHQGMHFHKGARNVNGPVVQNIQSSGSATGSITASWTVPDSLATTVENNGLYINIHTAAYPNGEIRGQVEF